MYLHSFFTFFASELACAIFSNFKGHRGAHEIVQQRNCNNQYECRGRKEERQSGGVDGGKGKADM